MSQQSAHTSAADLKLSQSYLELPETMFEKLSPTPVAAPELVVWNKELAATLGLAEDGSGLVDILSGNAVLPGSTPIAQAYMGHQFGYPNMLGDGRALLLGEVSDNLGRSFDLQLKGAGPTPYSRRGDGRAALGSMLREYLISEAMHALGIATTRSLAVVATGEPVFRQTMEPGAVLTRVASSHIRVGTFEYASHHLSKTAFASFLQYVIRRHYPALSGEEQPALAFLRAVLERQARLVVEWMRVGFIHGVMNTDNMSIPGETIDYGPCAFMNTYAAGTVFSSIDTQGRYAYGHQPHMAHWNLAVLAGSLLPLLHDDEKIATDMAQQVLNEYPPLYKKLWLQMMRNKLGLRTEAAGDQQLFQDMLQWMEQHQADYTNTFRYFTTGEPLTAEPYLGMDVKLWLHRWRQRQLQEGISTDEQQQIMLAANPMYIPRNQLVEEALKAATNEGNLDPFQALIGVTQKPYQLQPDVEDRYSKPPASGDAGYQTFCNT